MPTFTSQQRRLWSDMIEAVARYRAGAVSFSQMVGALEGALDAGDFEETDLRRRWYDLWTPLEIARATTGNETKLDDIEEHLSKMDNFLKAATE